VSAPILSRYIAVHAGEKVTYYRQFVLCDRQVDASPRWGRLHPITLSTFQAAKAAGRWWMVRHEEPDPVPVADDPDVSRLLERPCVSSRWE